MFAHPPIPLFLNMEPPRYSTLKRSAHFDDDDIDMNETDHKFDHGYSSAEDLLPKKRLKVERNWAQFYPDSPDDSPPLGEHNERRDGFFPISPPASPAYFEQYKIPQCVVAEDDVLESIFASCNDAELGSESGLRIIDLSSGEELAAIGPSSANEDDKNHSRSPSPTTCTFNLAKRHRDSHGGFGTPEDESDSSSEVSDEEIPRPLKKPRRMNAFHSMDPVPSNINAFANSTESSTALSAFRCSRPTNPVAPPFTSICIQPPFMPPAPLLFSTCPMSTGSELVVYNSVPSLPEMEPCYKWAYDMNNDDARRLVELDKDDDVKMMDVDTE